MSNQEEDHKLPKKLEELRSSNPYQVPEDYFYQVTDRIMDRVAEAEEKPSNVGQLLQLQPWWWKVSVAAIVLIALGYFIYNPPQAPIPVAEVDFEQISEEEIIDHFYSQEISLELLAEVIPATALPEELPEVTSPDPIPTNTSDIDDITIPSSDLEDFLLEQADETLIYEAL